MKDEKFLDTALGLKLFTTFNLVYLDDGYSVVNMCRLTATYNWFP